MEETFVVNLLSARGVQLAKEFKGQSVVVLKSRLDDIDLPTTGNKPDLVSRLVGATLVKEDQLARALLGHTRSKDDLEMGDTASTHSSRRSSRSTTSSRRARTLAANVRLEALKQQNQLAQEQLENDERLKREELADKQEQLESDLRLKQEQQKLADKQEQRKLERDGRYRQSNLKLQQSANVQRFATEQALEEILEDDDDEEEQTTDARADVTQQDSAYVTYQASFIQNSLANGHDAVSGNDYRDGSTSSPAGDIACFVAGQSPPVVQIVSDRSGDVQPSGGDVQQSGGDVQPSGGDVQPSSGDVQPSSGDEPSSTEVNESHVNITSCDCRPRQHTAKSATQQHDNSMSTSAAGNVVLDIVGGATAGVANPAVLGSAESTTEQSASRSTGNLCPTAADFVPSASSCLYDAPQSGGAFKQSTPNLHDLFSLPHPRWKKKKASLDFRESYDFFGCSDDVRQNQRRSAATAQQTVRAPDINVLRPLTGVLHDNAPVADIKLEMQQMQAQISELTAATAAVVAAASSAASGDQQMPQLTGNSNTGVTSTQIIDAAAMQMFISTAAVAATAASNTARAAQSAADTSDSDVARRCFEATQQHSAQLIERINLQSMNSLTFSGDPIDYHVFYHNFMNTVDCCSLPDSVKLSRLIESLKGKAHRVIAPCALGDPDTSYKRALTLLRKRFGDKYVIAEACVHKVIDGPTVKSYDAASIQEFADDLRECVDTLTAMGKLSEVDSRTRLIQLVERLPLYLQNSWRKKAVDARTKYDAYPNIEEFSTFIEETASYATDPAFGYKKPARAESSKHDSKPASAANFRSHQKKRGFDAQPQSAVSLAVNSQQQHSPVQPQAKQRDGCTYCGKPHSTVKCYDLIKMEPVERVEAMREKRACFNCCRGDHVIKDCRNTVPCGVDGCIRLHASILHSGFRKKEPRDHQKPRDATQNFNVLVNNTQNSARTRARYALPIVRVFVTAHGSRERILTYALLDPGSTGTFCAPSLLRALRLKGNTTTLPVSTLNQGCETAVEQASMTVCRPGHDAVTFTLPTVNGIETFPELARCNVTPADVRHYEHLRTLEIPDPCDVSVTLLIGQDNAHTFLPSETRVGKQDEPYAVRTPLGWAVNGPLSVRDDETPCNYVGMIEAATLTQQVERFWAIDSAGNTDREYCHSINDQRVIGLWDRTSVLVDGHFQIDVPFKNPNPCLPDNKHMANKRLTHLLSKLERDSKMKSLYQAGMAELIENGKAELVTDSGTPGRTWYIPHHAVVSASKPGKIRIVFDCAAQCGGVSINTEVHQGPDLTNKLIGVLLRYREKPIALMADVKAMFHQVYVTPEHRDALRFLWLDAHDNVTAYRLRVHLFGGIWSPAAANYALQRAALENEDNHSPAAVDAVMNYFYVDDMCSGAVTPSETIQLYHDTKALTATRGFELTKWVSSSKEVLAAIPQDDRAPNLALIDLTSDDLPGGTSLGLCFDPQRDCFVINVKNKEPIYTRRGLLSILSSLYDPLGFIAPFILIAKLLLQEEIRQGKQWDERLEPETRLQLDEWLSHWDMLRETRIPRYLHTHGNQVQLHHFADASSKGYGTASYVRVDKGEAPAECFFLFGKSRQAPIKTQSIVRLELMAAVTAVNVDIMLRREMRFQPVSTHYWSDSFTCLGYIHNDDKRYHTFTANRVSQIRAHTEKDQWRHVPGVINAADKASRGSIDLEENWLHAPTFLSQPESEWPAEYSADQFTVDASDKEVKCLTTVAGLDSDNCVIDKLCRDVESYTEIITRLAWLLKAAAVFRSKERATKKGLSIELMKSSETRLLCAIQEAIFTEELAELRAGRTVQKGSRLAQLEPTINSDGLLRATSRLDDCSLPDDVKHPIILPASHPGVVAYLRHVHKNEASHGGLQYMLNLLRRRFWIIGARRAINDMTSKCVTCQRLRHHAAEQRMAQLPEDRVTSGGKPFDTTGVDCFGPYLVRRGKVTEKRYGCVFTCVAVRAVHLESLYSLDTSSFIDALRRFIARRGVPSLIRSDGGTNFTAASKELNAAAKRWNSDPTLQTWLIQNKLEWRWNTPAASHHGGVWERMIRTIRKALDVTLSSAVPYDEGFATLLCEAEAIVNNRPLTPVSPDVDDRPALTPADLLVMRSTATLPPITTTASCTRRWGIIQALADDFWVRWTDEYLPLLRKRQKWLLEQRNLAVGDVVLMLDEPTARNRWPLGRIVETFPSADGLVRSVRVRVRGTLLCRPITKLSVLEMTE